MTTTTEEIREGEQLSAAERVRLIEAGRPAVEKFRRAFKPHGLIKVIVKAREVEGADGRAELAAAFAAAEAEVLKHRPNTPARLFAEQARDKLYVRAEKSSAVAMAESNRVWNSPWAIKAIRDDLERLRDAIVAEMDRAIETQKRFHRENDLPFDVYSLRGHCAKYLALDEFLHRHVVTPAALFGFRADDPNSCPGLDPTSACWPLLGCGWRQAQID